MVDFRAVAAAYAADVEAHGGEIRRGAAVRALLEREDRVEAVLGDGAVVAARRAVACAGAWSDRLALASGARPDVRIVPFRGAYLRLAPERADLVRGQIYPVPDPELPFLGVHLSRTVAGDVLIGPTALLAPGHVDLRATLRWPGTWRVMRRWWRTGVTRARARGEPPAARARGVALRPGDRRGRRAPGPAGVPRSGGRPRRLAGGRLPARPHRPRRPRAERAVAGRHRLARDRRDDRREVTEG